VARTRPELLELTSLRAFAALHVVLFHNLSLLGEPARALPDWLHRLLGTGYASVSFFFVLSGFVLVYASCEAEAGFQAERRAFWVARVARIYPVYLLSFLLDVPRALTYFLGTHEPLTGALKALVSGGAYLGLVQAWFPRVASAWNPPGWSLSAEAFFYLLLPALAAWVWRVRPARLGPLLAACAAVSLLLTAPFVWGFNAWADGFWRSLAGFNPLLRLPEFLAGVVLGRMYLRRQSTGRPPSLGWLAPLGVAGVLAVLLVRPRPPPLLLHNGLLLPLFALIIYGLATGPAPGMGWLRHPVLVLLGRASFALYILHQPLEFYVVWAGRALGVSPSPLLFTAYMALTVGLSLAVSRWLEEPARRWVAAALGSRPTGLLSPGGEAPR
jgi:peptidoglycan/LPS O-acetylase OafA/YrhL